MRVHAIPVRPLVLLAAVALGLAAPLPRAARAAPLAVTRDEQRDLVVTVYNGNLGLVREVREVRVPPGVHEVQFADVAARIDPTSVHLRALGDPAGLRVLEQNYEYDLLSPQKLLEKHVGQVVRLHQGSGATLAARLLSANGPIFEINGQIHTGYPGQIVFPALPENLVARPTLVWQVRSAKAAPQRVEASYLTGGLTWKADYVLVLDAADDRGDLSGWVTVDNRSGATFANAALKLVAGDVHRAPEGPQVRRALEAVAKAPADAAPSFVSEGFFEYHLYSLDGRTVLKDNQTKQLALLAASGVKLVKSLVFHGARDYYRTAWGQPVSNQKVAVLLELANRQADGLGLPLPRGKVRVYKADRGGSQHLVGEDWIDHTPKDERVRIKMGEAFDVVGERVQRDWRKLGGSTFEVEWEIVLRNHKAEDVTVSVVEPVPGDWEVLRASHAPEKVEAHTLRFQVPVAKGGASRLTYRVRLRF